MSAVRGVWQVLVMGSQNCPFTQLSGSAQPTPALSKDAAATGTAMTVDRRSRFRMPEFSRERGLPNSRILALPYGLGTPVNVGT